MNSPTDADRSVLHPASALIILGLDWLFFSGTVITLGLSTFASALLGLGIGGLATAWVQYRYSGDGLGKSLAKGVGAGIVVGIPLPIAGTAVGGGILALSGLDRFWGKGAGRLSSSQKGSEARD